MSAASSARTRKTCLPSLSFANLAGDVQGLNARLSMLHSKCEPGALEKRNVALRPLILLLLSSVCGATSRVTTTEKLFVVLFPEGSVVEHVTVVDPTGKVDPIAGVHATLRFAPELSWAAGGV